MMNILAPNANNLKDAKAHRDVITQVFSDMPAHQALQNNAEFVKSDFEALLDGERPILYLHRAKLEARVRLFKDFFPFDLSVNKSANIVNCQFSGIAILSAGGSSICEHGRRRQHMQAMRGSIDL